MNVYVVQVAADYGYARIVGVAMTPEKALKLAENHAMSSLNWSHEDELKEGYPGDHPETWKATHEFSRQTDLKFTVQRFEVDEQ